MNKAIQTNVITAVVTAGILGVLGWGAGVFEAGSDALSEQQIEAVLTRVMVTDSGVTYAGTLSEINLTLASMDSTLDAIKEDIDDLENAVGALASE
jgi:uncharacterized membrane protein affecting hemolysin expression